jgi:hypothetical protein
VLQLGIDVAESVNATVAYLVGEDEAMHCNSRGGDATFVATISRNSGAAFI